VDKTIRRRHRELVRALNRTPVPPGPDWADHYDDHAVMVRPDGTILQGRQDIREFLNGGEGLRPIESNLIQAEVGSTAYALSAFKIERDPPQTGNSMTVFARRGNDWRIVADIYGWAVTPVNAVDEWKECRTSIDRFDKLIADVRKYGFTLITGLLTAGAFAFAKLDGAALTPALRVGASVVLMTLVFGLFTVDRYLEMFLRAAVTRARQLEQSLALSLTQMISAVAEGSGTSTWATWLYTLFMLSAVLPWMVPTAPGESVCDVATAPGLPRAVVRIGLGFMALIWIYHFWTRLGLRAGLEGTKLWKTGRFWIAAGFLGGLVWIYTVTDAGDLAFGACRAVIAVLR
jgi:ketosteroid isomerase-like protein